MNKKLKFTLIFVASNVLTSAAWLYFHQSSLHKKDEIIQAKETVINAKTEEIRKLSDESKKLKDLSDKLELTQTDLGSCKAQIDSFAKQAAVCEDLRVKLRK